MVLHVGANIKLLFDSEALLHLEHVTAPLLRWCCESDSAFSAK